MNGKERIALAMRHQNPDRVPVMCQLSIGHYNVHSGFKPHEIWYDSQAFIEATLKLFRRYRFDGILVVVTGRPPDYLDQNLASIEETRDGEWLTWRNGDRTFMPWDDMPHHHPADVSKPERANFEQFDPEHGLDRIDHYLGHTWNVLYHMQEIPGKEHPGLFTEAAIPDYTFSVFDALKAAAPDLSIHGSVYSPLTHFFELFGYQEALMGFITDPGRAHAVLDRLTEHVIVYACALAGRGADAIDLSSAFVGAPFLSRKLYQTFVVPYERRVNEAIRRAGSIPYTHTCGRIGDRLDLMEQTGTLGIDTLDPPPLGNGDLAVAKRDFGERLFFKGNMNSVALLSYQTEAEVLAEASNRIETGKPGAGYILSTACSVAPRVEPWKLELLVPLAEQIGRY